MRLRSLIENSFDAAPGGAAGAVSTQAGYGTFASPEASQNPAHFDSSNANKADSNQTGSMANDLDQIYAKKETPTPDEIVTGIKYELKNQQQPDKAAAKAAVLANLKKDPHFYSSLKQLNISDKDMVDNMKVNESKHPNDAPLRPKVTPNIEETKKIFADMGKAHENKYVVNSGISEVMKQMWEQKKKRSDWKSQ